MLTLTFALYSATILLSVIFCARKSKIHPILPSICWFLFMAAPCFIQAQYFNQIYVDRQRIAVLITGFTLLAGDIFALLHTQNSTTDIGPTEPSSADKRLLYACALGVALIQLSHLFLMPKIPLVARITGGYTAESLALLREDASKLLRVPGAIKYIWQTSLVLAPAVIFALLRSAKKMPAFALFSLSLFYSYSTLARGPALAFIAILTFLFFVFARSRLWGIARLATNVSLIPIIVFAVTLVVINDKRAAEKRNRQTYATEAPGEVSFTWGDHIRTFGLLPGDSFPFATNAVFAKVLYRGFVVPSEVSHRWYIYYPDINGSKLGLYGLTAKTRTDPNYQPPANTVGNWAYSKRYPDNYGSTIGAYCSADADAHARFGMLGVIIAALTLLVLRALLTFLPGHNQFMRILEVVGVATMALTLPSTSVQALCAAHGMMAIICIMLVPKFLQPIKRLGRLSDWSLLKRKRR